MKTFWEMTHDERHQLYKNDPEAFDKCWKAGCNVEEQRQMWRLQAELRHVKNPIERMNRAGAKMYEGLNELRKGLLNAGFNKNNTV